MELNKSIFCIFYIYIGSPVHELDNYQPNSRKYSLITYNIPVQRVALVFLLVYEKNNFIIYNQDVLTIGDKKHNNVRCDLTQVIR